MLGEGAGIVGEPPDELGRVVRRREQQPTARAQDAAHLVQRADGIHHVLERLAQPDDVEGRVLERERAVERDEPRVDAAPARPAHRLRRDVGRDGRPGQRRGEEALAAPQVEHRVPARDAREQPVAADREALGLGALGDRGPYRVEQICVRHAAA